MGGEDSTGEINFYHILGCGSGRKKTIFHSDSLALLEASSGSKFEKTSLRTDRLLRSSLKHGFLSSVHTLCKADIIKIGFFSLLSRVVRFFCLVRFGSL